MTTKTTKAKATTKKASAASTATKKLQAKVAAVQKANREKLEASVLEASLNATLKLESCPALFDAKVKLAISSTNTEKLQNLVKVCSGIIDETPIQNTKSRAIREWAGSRRFAFGNQINLMYQLATGILYSASEHKELLLAYTGLDIELVEQLVEAFGSPAFYSRNNNVVVEAKAYDVDSVMATLAVMQSVLGVVVDTSKVTTANFSLEFGKGEVKALEDSAKANEAIADMETDL